MEEACAVLMFGCPLSSCSSPANYQTQCSPLYSSTDSCLDTVYGVGSLRRCNSQLSVVIVPKTESIPGVIVKTRTIVATEE